jgi:hypothetical protein
VDVSIHAVSPLLGTGGASAAQASVGPSAASAKPIVVKEVFEAVRMFSPGRFLIHLPKVTRGAQPRCHFDPQDAAVRRVGRTSAPLSLLVDISRDSRNKHRLPPGSSGTYACEARIQSADSVPQQISVQFPWLACGSTLLVHHFGAAPKGPASNQGSEMRRSQQKPRFLPGPRRGRASQMSAETLAHLGRWRLSANEP